MWNLRLSKQMIGTTNSMRNSDVMFYPSLTICKGPGVGFLVNGTAVEWNWISGSSNNTSNNSLERLSNLSDVFLQLFEEISVGPENRYKILINLY